MAAATYRILDEPSPGALSRYAVNPFWPMLSTMMAGGWLGVPWFVFNAFALGSATKKGETVLAVGALLVPTACLLGFAVVGQALQLPGWIGPYVRIAFTVIKLAFAYVIWSKQERSRALFEHFGGSVRNGAPVLMAGVYLSSHMPQLPFLLRVILL